MNPAAEAIAHRSRAELLGELFSTLVVERDFERGLNAFNGLLKGRPIDHEIFTIQGPTGEEIQIELSAFSIKREGETAGLWGFASDVTQRERQRKAATESEELLLQLTDNISEVFYLTSPDYREVIFVSPAYEEIWGRPVVSLYENPISRFQHVHPEDKEKVRAFLLKYPVAGPFEMEYRVMRPDGSVRWVQERGFPVPGDDGEIVRVAGTITDITDRKFLEEQLLHAQKMESIGRLAGGVAHDFNNLLMVVLNSARFVREELDEKSSAFADIDNIIEAGERGAHLVRQLLTYSRKQMVTPETVGLNDLIREISAMLDRTIGEDIELVAALAEDLNNTRIDPNQFVQVMLNLVVNARDAMPNGGTIGIETRNVKIDNEAPGLTDVEAGDYVCTAVSDTGHGMTKDVAAQIFEPFFTTKPKAEATGLGLSTVYGIVTQAGGQVNVYSEKGVGTTFKLYLPAVDVPVDAVDQPVDAPLRPSTGETILVAEDDEAVRALTSRILQRHGYRVLHATSGGHALERSDSHPGKIHVLLADVVMPGMSGRELGTHMQVRRPDTVVLYMSGYTADMIGRHGILGADEHYIQKPFTADELLRKLGQILN